MPFIISGGELLILGIRAFRNMHYSKYLELEKKWSSDEISLSVMLSELEIVNACDLILENMKKEIDLIEKEN